MTNAMLKSVLLNILAEVRAGAARCRRRRGLKRSDTATKPTTPNIGKRSPDHPHAGALTFLLSLGKTNTAKRRTPRYSSRTFCDDLTMMAACPAVPLQQRI